MPTIPRFAANPLIPGGYSQIDSSALQASSQRTDGPIIAVVGDCKGGAPNTALEFTNLSQLKGIARSGPAYDCARAAFIAGASRVILVRVGTPTQSSAALAGASGTPVTLTSLDYGAWTAGIKRTVAANNKATITFTEADGQTYNEVFDLGSSATIQQFVDAVNGLNPTIPKSKYVSAAGTTGTMPLSTATIAVLTTAGVDDSSIDAGDWTAGLAALETAMFGNLADIDLVCVATGDASVHAQAQAHCDAMSGTLARKERALVIGAVAGESVAAQVTRMSSLRNKRTQLVYPGISLFNDAGALTAYPPYVAAAFTAGKHAALPDVATSLVGENLGAQVVDVEKRLSAIPGGDLELLLAAGVTPIGLDPTGGWMYVDSLSGWITDKSFRDFHKSRTADYVAKFIRTRLSSEYKGQKTLSTLADEVRVSADQLAEQLTLQTIIRGHAPATVGEDPNDGSITYVNVPVVLPDTNKFIMLTVALQPASSLNQG